MSGTVLGMETCERMRTILCLLGVHSLVTSPHKQTLALQVHLRPERREGQVLLTAGQGRLAEEPLFKLHLEEHFTAK